MAFANKKNHIVAALVVFAATAFLMWFGNGLNPRWPLMWVAPLPVLLYSLRSSWWDTALVGGFAWLTGGLNLWDYCHRLQMSFVQWLSVFSVISLMFVLAVLLFRALALRGAFWSALLAFPAAWASFEYLNNLTSVHATAGSLAYTQLKFLPFLQLASITGPWGLSFVLLLFPAGVAIGLSFRGTAPKRALSVLGATVAVVGVVLLFGAVRLAWPQPQQDVTVGLIASDEPSNVSVTPPGAKTGRLFHVYAEKAEQLAAHGAQIVVLPEKLGVVLDSDGQSADSIFQTVADRTGATIVVGEVRVSPPLQYNQARVYVPGHAVMTYDKEHMLPPFESNLTPGKTLTLLRPPGDTWGVAICKDMDFTGLSRRYGQAGAGLLLVPAWDFNRDRTWHGHMAIMRGVEDGFSMARSAKNGFLTVSDSRGRIVAETRSDSAPFATLIARVPVAHHSTVYLRFGDWFGWLAIAMLGVSLGQLVRLGVQSRDHLSVRQSPVERGTVRV